MVQWQTGPHGKSYHCYIRRAPIPPDQPYRKGNKTHSQFISVEGHWQRSCRRRGVIKVFAGPGRESSAVITLRGKALCCAVRRVREGLGEASCRTATPSPRLGEVQVGVRPIGRTYGRACLFSDAVVPRILQPI